MVLVESPFVVEPTAGRFGCSRKNVDNKPWHGMLTSVPDDSPSGTTATNDSVFPLPHSSRIVSDEKKGVGGLSQQQRDNVHPKCWVLRKLSENILRKMQKIHDDNDDDDD